MDGKFKEWWWLPVLAIVWLSLQARVHWRILALIACAVALFFLAGCGTITRTVTVEVPVPVACDQAEPTRPALGIDTMPVDAPLDVQVRNLRADHDARDGYEGELRAALQACRTIGAK